MSYSSLTWVFVDSFIYNSISIIIDSIKQGPALFIDTSSLFTISIIVHSINHIFINETVTIIVSGFHTIEMGQEINEVKCGYDCHPFSSMMISNYEECFFIRIIIVIRFVSYIVRYLNSNNIISLPRFTRRNYVS